MALTRRAAVGLVLAGSVPLAGCLEGGSAGMGQRVKETDTVSMADSQFHPRNIHVEPETAVTWTNEDDRDHTVTSASTNWALDELVSGGESVTYSFAERGVYDVYCSFHGFEDLDGMSMKVAVGDATIEEPLGTETEPTDGDTGAGGAY